MSKNKEAFEEFLSGLNRLVSEFESVLEVEDEVDVEDAISQLRNLSYEASGLRDAARDVEANASDFESAVDDIISLLGG